VQEIFFALKAASVAALQSAEHPRHAVRTLWRRVGGVNRELGLRRCSSIEDFVLPLLKPTTDVLSQAILIKLLFGRSRRNRGHLNCSLQSLEVTS